LLDRLTRIAVEPVLAFYGVVRRRRVGRVVSIVRHA
jgi:hypothetical protein